jgi:hypothetical protein
VTARWVTRMGQAARLKPADRTLLARCWAALAITRLNLSVRSNAWLRRQIISQPRAANPSAASPPVERVCWAIGVASRLVPGSSCLCQALAARRVLASSGHLSVLRIGVAVASEAFQAHAWLESQGSIVIGQPSDEKAYSPLPLPPGDEQPAAANDRKSTVPSRAR